MPIPDTILPLDPAPTPSDYPDLAQEYLVALRELREAEDGLADRLADHCAACLRGEEPPSINRYAAYLALCACDAASDRWEAQVKGLDRNKNYTLRSN